ncbi:MAG: hypothetical protein HGA80_08305, partial [Candidatus Omnitrophica bacterium]|nr:hypothetical protein [Candidatus Omnitrophota bacterium]
MLAKRSVFRRICAALVLAAFLVTGSGVPLNYASAQGVTELPAAGGRLSLSLVFAPPLLKGIKVYRNDPLRFDFILDSGDAGDTLSDVGRKTSDVTRFTSDKLKAESNRLIKYFLASLTVPEKDLWVNLSPYEKDRIVPEAFGQTEMGRDLLAQDYILKQITASVIYPEGEVGKRFWARVYAEAAKRFGTTDIPVDTFNKVWIIPEKATVYENKDAAFVVESRLKVMLESDYLAQEQEGHTSKVISHNSSEINVLPTGGHVVPGVQDPEGDVSPSRLPTSSALKAKATEGATAANLTQEISKQLLREIVLPILEKEVNEGANFAPLRQVYNSLILATWYKRKIKSSILGRAYVDRNKVVGLGDTQGHRSYVIRQKLNHPVDLMTYDLRLMTISSPEDSSSPEVIWQKYVEAFRKGAYNFIREEYDPVTQETLPRKYFSGGAAMQIGPVFKAEDWGQKARLSVPVLGRDMAMVVAVDMKAAISRDEVEYLGRNNIDLTLPDRVSKVSDQGLSGTGTDEHASDQSGADRAMSVESRAIKQSAADLSLLRTYFGDTLGQFASPQEAARWLKESFLKENRRDFYGERVAVMAREGNKTFVVGGLDRNLVDYFDLPYMAVAGIFELPSGEAILPVRAPHKKQGLSPTLPGGYGQFEQTPEENILSEMKDELGLKEPLDPQRLELMKVVASDRPEVTFYYKYTADAKEALAIRAIADANDQELLSLTQEEYFERLKVQSQAEMGKGETAGFYFTRLDQLRPDIQVPLSFIFKGDAVSRAEKELAVPLKLFLESRDRHGSELDFLRTPPITASAVVPGIKDSATRPSGSDSAQKSGGKTFQPGKFYSKLRRTIGALSLAVSLTVADIAYGAKSELEITNHSAAVRIVIEENDTFQDVVNSIGRVVGYNVELTSARMQVLLDRFKKENPSYQGKFVTGQRWDGTGIENELRLMYLLDGADVIKVNRAAVDGVLITTYFLNVKESSRYFMGQTIDISDKEKVIVLEIGKHNRQVAGIRKTAANPETMRDKFRAQFYQGMEPEAIFRLVLKGTLVHESAHAMTSGRIVRGDFDAA